VDVRLSEGETEILHRELREASDNLAAALEAADPFDALVQMTSALETLSATQHELVNVLLDRDATWSQVADALSTSSAGARRRFPRRDNRQPAAEAADQQDPQREEA
jgi:nitrate reductase assembly molybdenum cofactor insertion protein NarJ